jgi:hypothetical protein
MVAIFHDHYDRMPANAPRNDPRPQRAEQPPETTPRQEEAMDTTHNVATLTIHNTHTTEPCLLQPDPPRIP